MRLKEKVAIVTGASKGIGKDIAKKFAEEGAKVLLAARGADKLQEVTNDIISEGGEATNIITDMRVKEDVKRMVEKTWEEYGKIDILVNNAGLPMFGFAIDDESEKVLERYQAIMETNFRGYWYAARFVVPYMKKNQKGAIINISSVRGKDGLANETAYCAVKGAVNMFTKSLAMELASDNIRVNTISPGAIQVDTIGHWVLSRYGEETHKEYKEKFKDLHMMGMKLNQPLRKVGRPEDVAYAAIYMASDEAKFVTGSNLLVDGGLTSLLAEPLALDLKALHDYYENSRELQKWFSDLE